MIRERRKDSEVGRETETKSSVREQRSSLKKKKKAPETTTWYWKLSGAEVIVLEAPADTRREAVGSIHQPAARLFLNFITPLLTLLLICITEPQALLPA